MGKQFYLIREDEKLIFCKIKEFFKDNEERIEFTRYDICANKLTSELPGGYWMKNLFSCQKEIGYV